MADGDNPLRTRRRRGDGILVALIVICVLIEAVLTLADFKFLGPPRLRLLVYEYGAFWPGLLHNWIPNFSAQPWTMFLTYGFLHGGLLHLGFNMITLWSLGRMVLGRIGPSGFLVVYGVSTVAGAGTYALLSTQSLPMVGASGALFGLAGALAGWAWTAQVDTLASLQATWRFIAFLVVINIVMYFGFSGGVAWQTHLGGFVAGWAAAILLDRVIEA